MPNADGTRTPQDIVDDLLNPKKAGDEVKHIKKEAKVKSSPKIKDKHYYTINVESMIPATLSYRVLAEDPQNALDLMRGLNPIGVKHRLIGKRDIKLTVSKSGSSIIELTKNLSGK